MFHNFLQSNDNSLLATTNIPSGHDEPSTSKDIHNGKHDLPLGEINTCPIRTEMQHHDDSTKSESNRNELKQAQILIVEAEKELCALFSDYLSSLGMNADATDRGDEALDRVLDRKEKERPYDAIIVDTHLQNSNGIDVAKRIRSEKPEQKMILVTTTPMENLPADCLETAGFKENDILTMPFKMSKLASKLKNQ